MLNFLIFFFPFSQNSLIFQVPAEFVETFLGLLASIVSKKEKKKRKVIETIRNVDFQIILLDYDAKLAVVNDLWTLFQI